MKTSKFARSTRTKALCAAMVTASSTFVLPVQAEVVGVAPSLPLINYSGNGTTQFDASTGVFSVSSVPVSIVLPPAKEVVPNSAGVEKFEVNIIVSNSGNLISGVPGNDLIIKGAVDIDGDSVPDVDGVLLKAEVVDFGYRDTGSSTDLFDFRFTVSGGQLAHLYEGYDVGLTMNSESSNFEGSFEVDFNGAAKGFIGAIDQIIDPVPQIEICTLVTLDQDSTTVFSDADHVTGDNCDPLVQGIPVGVTGAAQGTYKLHVTNIGNETLTEVAINAPGFGLVNQMIPSDCGSLEPDEVCVIEVSDPSFSGLQIDQVCTAPGLITQQAQVVGLGITSGIVVSDEDPATVSCVTEPHISIRKEVKLNKGSFMDANTPRTGPFGPLGSDAVYRFIVKNDGNEALSNVVINDAALGLVEVPLGITTLLPGQKVVVNHWKTGFKSLKVDGLCDSVGSRLNTVQVDAQGQYSSIGVSNSDVAYATCQHPQIQIRKEVSIDGENFFNANLPDGADVPIGIVGATDVTYRLTVKNIGHEKLIDVLVTDQDLGIEQVIGDLSKGEVSIINFTSLGFESLKQTNHCTAPGKVQNTASVEAIGNKTKSVVTDADPAYVKCVSGPSIEVKKQVTLSTRAEFKDADRLRQAPKGIVGDSGRYRFIIKNTGDEPLKNVRVRDANLGIDKVIGSIDIGEQRIIGTGQDGFGKLEVDNLCDTAGNKLNTVQVSARGIWSNAYTNDNDSAFVRCESAPVCTIMVDKTCSVSIPSDPSYNQTNADECEIPTSGANVQYSYNIRNTGNTDVTIREIVDSKLGNVLIARSRILEAGENFIRTLNPIFIKKTQSNSVSVVGHTDLGAVCQASDILKVIARDKPIAANEIGMVRGDPHYQGGDGGKWDFHGRHLAMFNLLSDTNLKVNTQYVAARPGINLEANVYLGDTRVVLNNVGGKTYNVQLSVDGAAYINGRRLRANENLSLANGIRIIYKKNPADNQLAILPTRGKRTTSAVLKVWTAEGYFIELAGFNAYNRWPSHVDMAVRTPAKGVYNGRMPSGILGQSFDADNEPLEYKDVNGWSFQVDRL